MCDFSHNDTWLIHTKHEEEGKICKLFKSLYGFKQASKILKICKPTIEEQKHWTGEETTTLNQMPNKNQPSV